MALEITVRDLEKQEEISKMVCECALLSMDEAGEHGDARTIVLPSATRFLSQIRSCEWSRQSMS